MEYILQSKFVWTNVVFILFYYHCKGSSEVVEVIGKDEVADVEQNQNRTQNQVLALCFLASKPHFFLMYHTRREAVENLFAGLLLQINLKTVVIHVTCYVVEHARRF